MSPGGCPITDGECPLTCGVAAGGGKLHSCAVSGRGPLGSAGCGNECASPAQGRHTVCVCVCTGAVGLTLVANPQNMVYTIQVTSSRNTV